MKATVQTETSTAVAPRSRVVAWSELVKIRLNTLALLTMLTGLYLGHAGALSYGSLLHALVGVSLVAWGGAALNQWWERDLDALMERTRDRPLPSGQMAPEVALIAGMGLATMGLAYLVVLVNPVTSVLAAVALGSYLLLYTPLKRITPLNTWVGAVPGALPALLGWTAAGRSVWSEGLALAAIVFFWQLPHFLAIAWLYRADYARAGFRMLPVLDPEGRRCGCWAFWHCLGLLAVSLCPAAWELTGTAYLAGASVLGLVFLVFTIRFWREATPTRARHLFYASIVYLPVLMALMVLDKAGS